MIRYCFEIDENKHFQGRFTITQCFLKLPSRPPNPSSLLIKNSPKIKQHNNLFYLNMKNPLFSLLFYHTKKKHNSHRQEKWQPTQKNQKRFFLILFISKKLASNESFILRVILIKCQYCFIATNDDASTFFISPLYDGTMLT